MHLYIIQFLIQKANATNIKKQRSLNRRRNRGLQYVPLEHARVYMIFVDLKKAFDMVPHDLIMESLEDNDSPQQYQLMIDHLLRDRETTLLIPERLENSRIEIQKGVPSPQGGPLSPIYHIHKQSLKLKRERDIWYPVPGLW